MTQRADLAQMVERLAAARVLVVGDLMLDRFVYGDVDRISPEAPVPVLRVARHEAMLGGAGNVVRNLSALGAESQFVAVTGNDRAGREVARLCGELPRVDANLVVDRGRETTIKTRYFAGTQQVLRADEESAHPVVGDVEAEFVRRTKSALAHADLVVLSDYGKGTLSPKAIAAVVGAAGRAGKPVLADPKGDDYARYRGARLITPNRRELAHAAKMPTGTDEEIIGAARRLARGCGIEAVLATRGPEGMTLVDGRRRPRHLPAEARAVFDVSGAGDTVIATVAAAMAAGLPIEAAASLANVAAGVVVGKTGTAAAYPDEIAGALHRQDLHQGELKLASHEQLRAQVASWRDRKLTVGFTNGCFDLLHPGHVSLLSQAKAACDRLIVAINADASVTRLKGKGRPVQTEAARAAVLGSLESVDIVAVFGEDTPLALIELVKPDVLVKGADYTLDEVVGADIVQRHGGKVVLAKLSPGFSTSATVRKLKT